jgi:hypothetical protein
VRATQPATTFGPDEKDDDDDESVLLLFIDDELDDVLAFGFDLAT